MLFYYLKVVKKRKIYKGDMIYYSWVVKENVTRIIRVVRVGDILFRVHYTRCFEPTLRAPCFRAFRLTTALPFSDFGPVDFSQGFHKRISSRWCLLRCSDQPLLFLYFVLSHGLQRWISLLCRSRSASVQWRID